MVITRVLNTNAVLSKNEADEEIVLLGAGVGFKSRPGDIVDITKVEKQFIMNNKQHQSRFQKMIESIPNEYILVSEHIISLAKNMYNMTLNESIHISLADHIYNAVRHANQNIFLTNALLNDIKQLYKKEYDIASQSILLIKEQLHCELPEDEAGFIAMHFINAQLATENMNVDHLVEFTKKLNDMIKEELSITFDEASLSYYRYITHLRFFAYRILQNVEYQDDNLDFIKPLLLQYPKEYRCAKKVCKYIKTNYHYAITKNEILYLTIHLAQLTKK